MYEIQLNEVSNISLQNAVCIVDYFGNFKIVIVFILSFILYIKFIFILCLLSFCHI